MLKKSYLLLFVGTLCCSAFSQAKELKLTDGVTCYDSEHNKILKISQVANVLEEMKTNDEAFRSINPAHHSMTLYKNGYHSTLTQVRVLTELSIDLEGVSLSSKSKSLRKSRQVNPSYEVTLLSQNNGRSFEGILKMKSTSFRRTTYRATDIYCRSF